MSFDELYKTLDLVNEKVKIEKCCESDKNHKYEDEIILCNICGKFVNNINNSPEWRFYGSEDSKRTDPTRCGMPLNVLLPESSIGTSINNKGNYMDRISTRQRWNSMPYKERSKYKVFVEIELKCSNHKLPIVISETAKSLYSVISDTKISRGENRRGVIAACVFNACKECNVPRSVNEVATIFDMNSKVLTKGCKNYTEIIRLSKINIKRTQNTGTIKVDDFIERFCYNISLDEGDIDIIKIIAIYCEKLNLVYDNTPPAMATGCIYLFCKLKKLDISKKIISENCSISEVTINKCYKKLDENDELTKLIQSKYDFTP